MSSNHDQRRAQELASRKRRGGVLVGRGSERTDSLTSLSLRASTLLRCPSETPPRCPHRLLWQQRRRLGRPPLAGQRSHRRTRPQWRRAPLRRRRWRQRQRWHVRGVPRGRARRCSDDRGGPRSRAARPHRRRAAATLQVSTCSACRRLWLVVQHMRLYHLTRPEARAHLVNSKDSGGVEDGRLHASERAHAAQDTLHG